MNNKKVLLVGGSGFIGNYLGPMLVNAGYEIHLLTRKMKKDSTLSFPAVQFEWNAQDDIPDSALEGVSSIINLAGESIGQGRWTAAKQKRILESRVKVTDKVVFAANKFQISNLLQASAIGYYGDRDSEVINEQLDSGEGFLARTSKQWEAGLSNLSQKTRSVVMRIGVVLGNSGGALNEILMPYHMGVGATVGSGKQYFSWIHIEDLSRFILAALDQNKYLGTYNLTAPEPITYGQLHKALLNHFSGIEAAKVPSFLLKLVLGKKAELILMSQRVVPERLQKDGFKLKFNTIDLALRDLLESPKKDSTTIEYTQWVPQDIQKVWKFFSTEKNLEKITPPFLHFKVESMSTPTIQKDSIIDYRLRLHGLPLLWRSKIIDFQPEKSFIDFQLKGPYKIWHHTHDFLPLGEGTLIRDKIHFKIPMGMLGRLVAFLFIKRDIEKIFSYRKKVVSDIFA